jgi:hypothetical protein
MTNDQRTAVYLRDRSDLTPAQSRRFAKHEHRALRPVALARVGRIRRAFLRSESKRLRREGANLVAAVRSGYFRRPKVQKTEKAA